MAVADPAGWGIEGPRPGNSTTGEAVGLPPVRRRRGTAFRLRHLLRGFLRCRELAVAARPPLVPGERLLTAELDADGMPVVATDRAIYRRQDGDGGGWLRLGWELVDRIDWDNQRHTLRLTGLT